MKPPIRITLTLMERPYYANGCHRHECRIDVCFWRVHVEVVWTERNRTFASPLLREETMFAPGRGRGNDHASYRP